MVPLTKAQSTWKDWSYLLKTGQSLSRMLSKMLWKIFFKVHWSPVLTPFRNGDNKTVLKSSEQQFMSVIKFKPKLYETYIEVCKNLGRREGETDINGFLHWTLILPSKNLNYWALVAKHHDSAY